MEWSWGEPGALHTPALLSTLIMLQQGFRLHLRWGSANSGGQSGVVKAGQAAM